MGKRIKVESVDNNGNEVVVWAVKPGAKEFSRSKIAANKAFRIAVKDGALMRDAIDSYMRQQGVWDDEKQSELDQIEEAIVDDLKALQKGGELFDGYDAAIRIKTNRIKQNKLSSKKRQLDSNSLEAQMDDASMDCLAFLCIKDEEGNQKFKSLDDYLDSASEPWAQLAAAKVAYLAFNLEEDWQSKLPENQFLKSFGFLNKDGMLLDKTKKFLVALDGRKINKDGLYLEDENGNSLEIYDLEKPFGDFTKGGRKVSVKKPKEDK